MNKLVRLNLPGFLALLIVSVLFSACAKKIVFQPSVKVPAATGKVKVKKDANNNYSIRMDIRNLADPGRLSPPAKVYVVWIMTKENGLKNIGQIKPSTGFLSGKVKASLEAVSPYKPTRVFITAERNTDILYPGNEEILSTRDF